MPVMEIPSIHVEDTSAHDVGGPGCNWDLFKRISALLDNSLDLSNISGISLQPEQVRAAMSALSNINQQTANSYGQADPNLMSPNIYGTGMDLHGTSRDPNQGWQNQSTATSASAPPPLISLPQALAQLQHDNFIQGAISNRTLEQLTESMTMRPYRAIRAEQNRYSAPYPSEETTNKPVSSSNYNTQSTAQYAQQQQPAPPSGNQYQDYQVPSRSTVPQSQIQNQYASNGSTQYGHGQNSNNPYGHTSNNPYGHNSNNPYGHNSNPYGHNSNPQSHTAGTNPYAQAFNPYFEYGHSQDYSSQHQGHSHDLQDSHNQFSTGGINNNNNNNNSSSMVNPYSTTSSRPSSAMSMSSIGSMSSGSVNPSHQSSVGVIGDRPCTPADKGSMYSSTSRSQSPTDSDTSGFSSGGESDIALADLMNSLSIATNPNPSQNPSQLTYYPLVPAQFDIMKALGVQNEAPGHGQPQQPLLNDFGLSADLFASRPYGSCLNSLFSTTATDPYSIERAAKLYRNAASICEATCTWSGQLPPKVHKSPNYSCKVFLGGVPWDITEAGLQNAFKPFGPMKIEWPGKDGKHPRYQTKAGYVYVLFECDKSVKALLQSCTHDFSNGGEFYFKISSRRMRSKEVQVIPWVLSDSNYVKQPSQRLDPSKTVFVGALHGMMNAEGLAHIMNDLFGNVVYAGIDTDKHKYPIGSGRVTFSSHKSYMKAVNAAFVEVKTPKFTKKVQIDPYLEDSMCNICNLQAGPFFCRDLSCFRYYCRTCWQWYHALETTCHHKPLMRNSKPNGTQVAPIGTMNCV